MKYKIENFDELTDSRELLEAEPNKFTSIFIYIVLLMILSFFIWAWFSDKEIVVTASGIVRPNDDIYSISNSIDGEVEKISMVDGQKVKKGQFLYKVNTQYLSNKKSQLKKQQAFLEKNIKRLNNTINESTNITGEKNENDILTQIQEKIFLENYKLDEVKSTIKDIDNNIDKCTIKSPIDGYLDLKCDLEIGTIIKTGSLIATILPDSKSYKVELMIDNRNIATIKDGQEIKYSFNSLPYKEYGFIKGKINSISSNAKIDREKELSYYSADGSLNKNSLQSNTGEESFIKPGMICEGRIITRKERMLYYLLEKIGFK